jgi:predicted phage gp36 major capsid-like protein
MANQIPLSGLTDAAGGYLLPDEQGQLLTTGILNQTAAFQVAGDVRTTTNRRTEFPIWLGEPTAGFVGEAGTKAVTGAEFGQGTLNIKKVASIVLFTDEQIEDVQNGDLNVLVDSGVRDAISKVIDQNAVGRNNGSAVSGNFDTELCDTTSKVELDLSKQDGLATAVSAAMGTLESNGYTDPNNMALILASDAPRHLRDARQTSGGTASATAQAQGLYIPTVDPLYGLERSFSSNLDRISATAGSNKTVALLVYKPNLHVRVRSDITVSASSEATVYDGSQTRNLWQENLTGLRYETRVGFFVHDLNRAVVKINNES